MKLGMSKREAEKRIKADEFTWPDLAKLLRVAAPVIRPFQWQKSKIANIPLTILFHSFSRTAKRLKGRVKGSDHEDVAVELLREFGVAKKGKS